MARAVRFALFGLIILLPVLAFGRSSLPLPEPAERASAQGVEAFTKLLPDKVYSGIPSHGAPADADPTLDTNGYCVEVRNEGHRALDGDVPWGFTIQNGDILSTDYFDNGSATTTDDVYCVTATARRITNKLPRPDMVISWTYTDQGSAVIIHLDIDVVTVRLKGIAGAAGGVASVCTEGWDPDFLTGFAANQPRQVPFVKDKVVAADWSTNPSNPPTILGVARQEPEWCVNFTAPVAVANVSASLHFWARYRPDTNEDDREITETQPNATKIDVVSRPELKHIDSLGQVVQKRVATPNVIGAIHTACILPSVGTDVLAPENISILSDNGAVASHLFPFKNTGQVPGVPPGTSCFSWTSVVPGSQDISVVFTVSAANPALTKGTYPVLWDTDLDGNDGGGPGAFLHKDWDLIDRTVINTGGDPFLENLDGFVVPLPIQFSVSTGQFEGKIGLAEWVIGRRPDPNGSTGEPIEGVPVTMTITSQCGNFNGVIGLKVLEGVTVAGRIPFELDITGEGCSPGQYIELSVQARYPDLVNKPPVVQLERVAIQTVYFPPESSPILAWAGTTVRIPFPFAVSGECADITVIYSRSTGQPGSFLNSGAQGDFVRVGLQDGDICEPKVFYESEDPGEVDIIVQVEGFPSSKVHIPIFFLALEDIAVTVDQDTKVVSSDGRLAATVRGWFVGQNPSNRPQETKDGRTLPARRWIIPDDWSILKGPDDFRGAWPSNPSMPPARVTFFMENEPVANGFKTGVKSGSSGFFRFDDELDGEFSWNVHPDTQVPTVLGSDEHPRIVAEYNDEDGVADTFFIGDFNLSFEGCAVNAPTGNQHCKPGDVVGTGRFRAVADYPENRNRGKWPQVTSPVVTTTFTWLGYKQVTWVDGETPAVKYVVAHLKDRDGFCDAVWVNNVLGVQVNFKVDGGEGIFTHAADRPFMIGPDKRIAVSTTFDTESDFGVPINVEITKTVIEEDECQAWVRIDNSLEEPVDVHVTFPGTPSNPIPDLRLTFLSCSLINPFVELKNFGPTEISLAGYSIHSQPTDLTQDEEIGLIGHLKPGESVRISGIDQAGWLFASQAVIFDPGINGEFAALVWDGTVIDFADCLGNIQRFPLPQLTANEGPIQLDIIVPFEARQQLVLAPGWNLLTVSGTGIAISEAAGTNMDKLIAIYVYDPATDTWGRFVPGAPNGVNTIDRLEPGKAYWVYAQESFQFNIPKFTP